MPTNITFHCDQCGQAMRVAADKAGRKAKCTKFAAILTIPQGDTADEVEVVAVPSKREAERGRGSRYEDDDDRPRRGRRDEDDDDRGRRRGAKKDKTDWRKVGTGALINKTRPDASPRSEFRSQGALRSPCDLGHNS